jgi:hypothetical protein
MRHAAVLALGLVALGGCGGSGTTTTGDDTVGTGANETGADDRDHSETSAARRNGTGRRNRKRTPAGTRINGPQDHPG